MGAYESVLHFDVHEICEETYALIVDQHTERALTLYKRKPSIPAFAIFEHQTHWAVSNKRARIYMFEVAYTKENTFSKDTALYLSFANVQPIQRSPSNSQMPYTVNIKSDVFLAVSQLK